MVLLLKQFVSVLQLNLSIPSLHLYPLLINLMQVEIEIRVFTLL